MIEENRIEKIHTLIDQIAELDDDDLLEIIQNLLIVFYCEKVFGLEYYFRPLN